MSESRDDFKKVSFDARLHYYQELMRLERISNEAAINGDIHTRFIALRRMFTLSRPWMRSHHDNEILLLFGEAKSKLSVNVSNSINRMLKAKVMDILTDIDDKIHIYGKHLWLPEAGSDDDDVDWGKIIERGRT